MMSWRDDLVSFVLDLDPFNPELPGDFDPEYFDKSGFNAIMTWISCRPGTPFLSQLFRPVDVNEEESARKCIYDAGIRIRLPGMRLSYETVWENKNALTYLFHWISQRVGESIPPELLYEKGIKCLGLTAAEAWIVCRKGESIPAELYSTLCIQEKHWRNPLHWRTPLHLWVSMNDCKIDPILLRYLTEIDYDNNTALVCSIMKGIDIRPELAAEVNIKVPLNRGMVYPIQIWKELYPYVSPPAWLYPDGQHPDIKIFMKDWENNLLNFILLLDPDNLVLPEDFNPKTSIYHDGKMLTPMSMWILTHPEIEVPDQLRTSEKFFIKNPHIESPLATWIRAHKTGEVPEYLKSYIHTELDDGEEYEVTSLMRWIMCRKDPVPDFLWAERFISSCESNDFCASGINCIAMQGYNAAGTWLYYRREPLPQKLHHLLPYLLDYDEFVVSETIAYIIIRGAPFPYEVSLYFEEHITNVPLCSGIFDSCDLASLWEDHHDTPAPFILYKNKWSWYKYRREIGDKLDFSPKDETIPLDTLKWLMANLPRWKAKLASEESEESDFD